MNVFEDLIGDLKNENLLEETVIDVSSTHADEAGETEDRSAEELPDSAQLLETAEDAETAPDYDLEVINEPSEDPAAVDPQEFYRKRAMDEVSGLQMVDHVLTGVEREQMKTMPRSYDDLSVKKCLHRFLQALTDKESGDYTQIEFQLMQETESWCSALAQRDADISAASLRRFCENSRPALSSQALISLAKFYRNLPYSEAVRNKFDFIVTRLFSKEIANEKRYMVFGREEMIAHFKTLYADWSSISLYDSNEDDSDTLVVALRYEDFIVEAENAENFDDLIRTEFFDRIRQFKESADEMFFAPIITASAVECNVRVGNRIVDLLDLERSKVQTEEIYDKYGTAHDQVVSDATSRTTELVDLLKERFEELEAEEQLAEEAELEREAAESAEPKPKKEEKAAPNKWKSSFLAVNKWLLITTIVVFVACLGLYIWSEHFAGEEDRSVAAGVVNFDLDNSSLKEHLKTARISNEVFYGITAPSWDSLSQEKKEEFVHKIFSAGVEKGFRKVQLSDARGKTVATASANEGDTKVN
jgi:hypothetical protein